MKVLEEQLVQAGLMTPEEVYEKTTDELFENQMERATQIFYDVTHQYYPELIAPMYEKITKETRSRLPKPENVEVQPENHNELSLGDLGDILSAVIDYREINRRDVLDDDFFNDYFRFQSYPEEEKMTDKQFKFLK